MGSLAARNWLRRRLITRSKAKVAVADAESSEWLGFTEIAAALADAESGGVEVGYSELELSKPSAAASDDVFGTPVLFKPIDK